MSMRNRSWKHLNKTVGPLSHAGSLLWPHDMLACHECIAVAGRAAAVW